MTEQSDPNHRRKYTANQGKSQATEEEHKAIIDYMVDQAAPPSGPVVYFPRGWANAQGDLRFQAEVERKKKVVTITNCTAELKVQLTFLPHLFANETSKRIVYPLSIF